MKNIMVIFPVLAGALWGAAGIFVRTFDAFGFDNISIIFIRILTASVLLFAGIFIKDRAMLRIKLSDLWIFIGSAVFGIIGLNLFYNFAITSLNLSLAAVLLSTSPVFVMILASILLKERITLKKVGCTALAVVGCILVSGVLEAGNGSKFSILGAAAGVAAALFYAVYSIFSKMAMKQRYNVFTSTFYGIFIATLALAPFADWHIMGEFIVAAPVKNSVFILLNAICASVLPYMLYTWSLSYVETGKVSILASGGEPAAAMVFGVVFFHEIPTILSICGLAVTIVALWLLCRPSQKTHVLQGNEDRKESPEGERSLKEEAKANECSD